jgi:hypothetical protein
VHFIALTGSGRIEQALDRARESTDRAAWEALEIDVRSRKTDGGVLDEVLAGRPDHALELREAHERHALDRATWYADIAAEVPDPPALDVLQGALGVLQALAAEDDLVLGLDAVTARWWSPGELLALGPERPFELDEHVQIVVEAVERRPGVGHIVRSRGLIKLARPDVAARAPRKEAGRFSELVRDLARVLGEGEQAAVGDRLGGTGLPPVTWTPRSEDCLADASPESAPIYELRDLVDGQAAADCAGLRAALAPRPRAK